MKSRDQILLEEAYLQVIKEQVGQGMEFYHATTANNMDSFVQNGIDIQRAGTLHGGAGAAQGKGFYLFKNKRDAINHAHGYVDGDDSIIVVIKANELDPKNFDVDYEASNGIFKRFLFSKETIDYLTKKFEGTPHLHQSKSKLPNGSNSLKLFSPAKNKEIYIVLDVNQIEGEPEDGNIRDGTANYQVASALEKNVPELFAKFEKENLNQASVLKYNGTEKIWPIRIENPEGRVLWTKDELSWDDVFKS